MSWNKPSLGLLRIYYSSVNIFVSSTHPQDCQLSCKRYKERFLVFVVATSDCILAGLCIFLIQKTCLIASLMTMTWIAHSYLWIVTLYLSWILKFHFFIFDQVQFPNLSTCSLWSCKNCSTLSISFGIHSLTFRSFSDGKKKGISLSTWILCSSLPDFGSFCFLILLHHASLGIPGLCEWGHYLHDKQFMRSLNFCSCGRAVIYAGTGG